jgi:hypothetical protein
MSTSRALRSIRLRAPIDPHNPPRAGCAEEA